MLVVAVDAERGQQDRNDEGEEYSSCDHCAAQLIAQRACGRAHGQVSAAWQGRHREGLRGHTPGQTAEAVCQPHQLYCLHVTNIWMVIEMVERGE